MERRLHLLRRIRPSRSLAQLLLARRARGEQLRRLCRGDTGGEGERRASAAEGRALGNRLEGAEGRFGGHCCGGRAHSLGWSFLVDEGVELVVVEILEFELALGDFGTWRPRRVTFDLIGVSSNFVCAG